MVIYHHQLSGHEFESTLEDRGAWHSAVHGVADLVTKQQHQLLYNGVLVSAV